MKLSKPLILAVMAMVVQRLVHGEDLLFLGPGRDSSGQSEVFSLPSMARASCTVPTYPHTDFRSSVAFISDGHLTICGGYDNGRSTAAYLAECNELVSSTWYGSQPFSVPRRGAAAVTMRDHSVLVSGGYSGSNDLQSSEVLTVTNTPISSWSPGPLKLPTARDGHCMILLSNGELFLHGGHGGSRRSDSYISTDLSTWTAKLSSKKERSEHACAELVRGTEKSVWVGGGDRGRGDYSCEIYSLSTDSWEYGPNLPGDPKYYPGEFIPYRQTLIYAGGYGNENIYQLKDGWTQQNAWTKMGEMSRNRRYFPALIISENICRGEKIEEKPTPKPMEKISGTLQSPNFPNRYPNNHGETYNIEVQTGKIIEIIFETFELEDNSLCSYDWLKIIDVGYGSTLLEKFCGSNAPAKLVSQTNKVDVLFYTDGSVTRKGFKLQWKATTEISYNDDESVGYVSGSLVKLVMAMASNESKQHEVSCCSGEYAAMTTKTCGNGVSCENICGGQSSGCLNVICEECKTSSSEEQVCDASMQEEKWCANANIIHDLTSQFSAGRKKRTPRIAPGITTMIININYCPFKCRHVDQLRRMPLCCLHPYTRRRVKGVPRACCHKFGLCI